MRRILLCCSVACFSLSVWGGIATAADLSLSWSGVLEIVDTNAPGAIYGSGVPGVTPFSGFVVYPDACVGCIVEPFPPESTNYVFPSGSGGLAGAGEISIGIESSVEIVNDEIVDQDIVDIAAIFGITLTLGQTLDTWSAASETPGEFTPEFIDWDVAYIYATTNPFSNTNYVPTPPPNPDIILFSISQDDGDVFLAIGEVTSVPEPGVTTMLACGIVGIAIRKRRVAIG